MWQPDYILIKRAGNPLKKYQNVVNIINDCSLIVETKIKPVHRPF